LDLEQGEYCYRRAVKLNASNYIGAYNLANILSKSGQYREAFELYELSITIYPGYVPALLNLGLLKLEAGDVEGARDLFRKGVNKDIRMAILCCECELSLGNINAAEGLLHELDGWGVKNLFYKQRINAIYDIYNTLK